MNKIKSQAPLHTLELNTYFFLTLLFTTSTEEVIMRFKTDCVCICSLRLKLTYLPFMHKVVLCPVYRGVCMMMREVYCMYVCI